MDDQNKNLILATALSFLVILIWFVLFPPEESITPPDAPAESTAIQGDTPTAPTGGSTTQAPAPAPLSAAEARAAALEGAARLAIDTPELEGSISLTGGRIDDLSLKKFRETLAPTSDIVTLLSPEGSEDAYYALYGWSPSGDLTFDDVPGAATLWNIESGETLTPDSPVTLVWDNGKGLTFRREISVDTEFLFSITQSVENTGAETRRIAPYGIIARHGEPDDLKGFFIIQEGPIRQTGDELQEYSYDDITDFAADARWGSAADVVEVAANGWLGFTDHYWMTTLIPESADPFTSVLQYDPRADVYRATAWLEARDIAPGTSTEVSTRLFAGAKKWEAIRNYENVNGIYRFLDSIDWGWFFFLTKPIFAVLYWLNGIIGNMGWSIICLTLIIKAIVLPLAFKSYVSMAKMKELAARDGEDQGKAPATTARNSSRR